MNLFKFLGMGFEKLVINFTKKLNVKLVLINLVLFYSIKRD